MNKEPFLFDWTANYKLFGLVDPRVDVIEAHIFSNSELFHLFELKDVRIDEVYDCIKNAGKNLKSEVIDKSKAILQKASEALSTGQSSQSIYLYDKVNEALIKYSSSVFQSSAWPVCERK